MRRNLDQSEAAIIQVFEEKQRVWERQMDELRQNYASRLQQVTSPHGLIPPVVLKNVIACCPSSASSRPHVQMIERIDLQYGREKYTRLVCDAGHLNCICVLMSW